MNKFSILLLDDVPENIYSLKLLIEENFDINIFTALKAQEAIEIVMNNPIDLILTDVQMPDIDGFEFAQYLKDIESTKDIPVIFITGIYEKDEYKNKGYNIGGIEYITKPIDNKLLISKLKIYINIFNTIKTSNEKLHKTEDLLIHSAKMASMGEMIGLISHQLKQPLNVLSLYVEDINLSYEYKELNDTYMEDFYKNTKDQVEYMNKTINGFLDFFNPNKKKEIFLIKNSIYQSINILKSKIDKLEVIFHLNIDKDLELFGVEVELTQVLINIINNSLDAFKEKNIKNPEIFIKLFKKDNKSILIIEDNALGIENNQLEKILEPYFTTKSSGTGVGLHMVKMIIKNSFDGELKVLNTQRGLSFIIFL
ncbi:MAG: hybrid sensor histidine kinase/response regulator [Aliarcobacter sp.]|nr:hybrid sensor histidine kinase/response regulator [Aliarcobacter sp.]